MTTFQRPYLIFRLLFPNECISSIHLRDFSDSKKLFRKLCWHFLNPDAAFHHGVTAQHIVAFIRIINFIRLIEFAGSFLFPHCRVVFLFPHFRVVVLFPHGRVVFPNEWCNVFHFSSCIENVPFPWCKGTSVFPRCKGVSPFPWFSNYSFSPWINNVFIFLLEAQFEGDAICLAAANVYTHSSHFSYPCSWSPTNILFIFADFVKRYNCIHIYLLNIKLSSINQGADAKNPESPPKYGEI